MSLPPRLLDDDQRLAWLRLSRSQNVGPALFHQLVNRFGGAREALEALPSLAARAGARKIRIYPADAAARDMERAAAIGARFVAPGEAGYPPLLRHIQAPPPLLCIKGRTELTEMPPLAIVGARNASIPGRKFARMIAAEVAAAGYAVVSGLALGVDAAAHEGALERATIAVLAGGLDKVYPRRNAALMEAIAEKGLLVSEMPPGTAPRAELFPRRNRIVSGMSLGVLVVEAAFRSGSLITARLAAEQGREVMACPGSPLDPRAAGTNRLIRDGATMVTEAEHVFEALAPLAARPLPEAMPMRDGDGAESLARPAAEAPRELHRAVLALLGPVGVSMDELIRESGAPAGLVMAAVMDLELAGALQRDETGLILRTPRHG